MAVFAMLAGAELRSLLESAFPGAQIDIEDLTGGQDHYRVRIVSEHFRGVSRLAQHRLVYRALGSRVGREVHALALDTSAP